MTSRALLLVILAIAGFLRLQRLSSVPPGLYHDEAMNGSNALEALETGRFQVFYPENNGREGLYVNVAAGFIRILGNEAWALRLPAAIFGILTVWGLYLLAAELFPAETALLAAFFLATSFWHVLFSRMAFRAIAAPMFITWALVAILRARSRTGRSALLYWTLAGVVYGLGFYTYIAYRATPLLVAAVLISQARKSAHGILIFTTVSIAVTAPLMLYFAEHPGSFLGHTSQVAVWRDVHPAWEVVLNVWRTARMFFTRGDYNWRHNVAWRAQLLWPVAILLVVGVILALRHRREHLIPLVWLAVAAIPVVLSNEGVPHALRSILMIPPACILAAIGAVWIPRALALRTPRALLATASAALLLGLCYDAYHTYFRVWAMNPNVAAAMEVDATIAAGEINRTPPEIPKYVLTPEPMAAQPVMYLTGSYTATGQQRTNIHYLIGNSCREATESRPQAKVFCLAAIR